MADECLTKPCAECGQTIDGANWHCKKCNYCLCLTCGYEIDNCPKCGKKLT